MPIRRRGYWLLLVALLLVAAVTVGRSMTRPGPYKAAYDRIALGQDEPATERYFAGLPERAGEPGGMVAFDWEGLVAGERRHVRGGDDRA